jgi:hypothetical protein
MQSAETEMMTGVVHHRTETRSVLVRGPRKQPTNDDHPGGHLEADPHREGAEEALQSDHADDEGSVPCQRPREGNRLGIDSEKLSLPGLLEVHVELSTPYLSEPHLGRQIVACLQSQRPGVVPSFEPILREIP